MHSKVLAKTIAKTIAKTLAMMFGTSLALASFGAQAMPAGSIAGATTAPQIIPVIEGCGRGMEIGPGGRCRPIGGRRVVVVPGRPVVVAPRPRCGVHVGPIGVATPC